MSEPRDIAELYACDPRTITKEEIAKMVQRLREQRGRMLEAEAKGERAPMNKKLSPPSMIDLKDLGNLKL